MAKFFITNRKDWYEETKALIDKSDYQLSFDNHTSDIYALAVHKLKYKNINACKSSKDNDFVIATGTAIYKESLEYDEILLEDDVDIERIRKNTIGQYAYSIFKDNILTIFGDGFGAYNIYYYIDNKGSFYISNFLYDLATVLKKCLSINYLNLSEQAAQRAILGDGTIFNEVYRLSGEQSIVVKKGTLEVVLSDVKTYYPLINDKLYKDIVSKQISTLKHHAQVIAKVMGTPAICMTGGLDSRISLAAYNSVGVKPLLCYLKSDSNLLSPESQDELCVIQMANTLKCDTDIRDLDTNNPSKNWAKYLSRYGFLYTLWGGCDDVVSFFENVDAKLLTCGYGGELYRNVHEIEHRKEPFTLDEVFDAFYMRHGACREYPIEEMRPVVKKKIKAIFEKYGVDTMCIKPTDLFYLYAEYRKVADSLTVNYVNLIGYSNMLMMEMDVLQLSRVNNIRMDDAKYMLEIINGLSPEVLNVPIYSHHELRLFDRRNMKLISGLDVYRSPFVRILKRVYYCFKGILHPLRNLYKKVEKRKTGLVYSDSMKYVVSVPNRWQSLNEYAISFDEPNLQLAYTMDLYALNSYLN